jgi:hypothetical protein
MSEREVTTRVDKIRERMVKLTVSTIARILRSLLMERRTERSGNKRVKISSLLRIDAKCEEAKET